MDLLVASNDKIDIIDIHELDLKFQNLVIFDYFVTETDQK